MSILYLFTISIFYMKINLTTAIQSGVLFHGGSCLTEALVSYYTHIIPRGSTFGLSLAWLYGAFSRFGDLFHFCEKMVLYIVTHVIKHQRHNTYTRCARTTCACACRKIIASKVTCTPRINELLYWNKKK